MEGAMHDDSRNYRDSAAECLLAFQDASQPYYRNLFLSMAASWLSLAHQDEAIDNLVRDMAKPIMEPANAGTETSRPFALSGSYGQIQTEQPHVATSSHVAPLSTYTRARV
jgi:hypothetical protein